MNGGGSSMPYLKKQISRLFLILCISPVIILFQNCSPSMQSGLSGLSTSPTNDSGHSDQPAGQDNSSSDSNKILLAQQISAGSASTCIIDDSQQVKCWGSSDSGSGIFGTSTALGASFTALAISGLGPVKKMSINAGGITTHACAITTNDTVKCWGRNESGQLGNNSITNSKTPVDVFNLGPVKSIALGGYHTCAITINDTVKCWGYNGSGQIGNNSTVNSKIPIDVQNLNAVKSLATGSHTTCAITMNDTVKCWGNNSNGQLGNNSTTNSSTPVDVLNLSSVKSVYIGNSHACAITMNEAVKCWGYNFYGQLGNDSTVNSSTPVDVLNLASIKSIAIGNYHTCAITSDNHVRCWGG